MDNFSHAVITHRKSIFAAFLIAAVLSVLLTLLVNINYDMADYLPGDAQSTSAIRIMEDEFEAEMPNLRVMLTDLTVQEALAYKEKIASVDGVSSVMWLDDIIGLDTLKTTPLEFLDPSVLKSYYREGNALLSVTVESGREKAVLDEIYAIIGENNAAAGEAAAIAETQSMAVTEVLNALAILLPVILIILIISTSSWIEPLLFLITIGIAILINMGTNIIFGEISFITRTVSPILQLAVSLDYAIFLLHSFDNHRSSHAPEKAMMLAMKEAMPSVAASAATTVVGFAALVFMRFGIGADLGLNLLKGIILSFISVMVFLPVITLMLHGVIEKTRHRKLMPDFKKTGSLFMKVRIPFLIITLIVVVPCYLAQSNTDFKYGMNIFTDSSRVGRDTAYIEEKFGAENTLVLLVPKESAGRESELCDDLSSIPHVTGIAAYVTAAGAEIPPEFVPEKIVSQFYSQNYARIIIYTDTDQEGDEAFHMVRNILDTSARHYETYYLSGSSAILYDMKNVISVDTSRINLIAIIGILVVLLITFRSLMLPVFLLFTIETAIWINLSFPYFADKPLSFIGYLIISTVQLGATVDYAILFTNYYMNNRKMLPKKEAMRATIGDNLPAILISAGILATAGFTLAITSSNPIISELGTLLGRGTLLSLLMVACVLPALLVLFDGLIHKATLKRETTNMKEREQQ